MAIGKWQHSSVFSLLRVLLVCCLAVLLWALTAILHSTSSPAASVQEINSSELPSCFAPPPQAFGYHLKFSTHFNPLNLSPNSLGSYTWYNPGMWWETPAPYHNIFLLNSALNLVWTSGQPTADTSISTAAQDGSYYQGWHYGYFEARMRWNTVDGAWPAIWMIPIQDILSPGQQEEGELDIFEGQGNTPDVYYGTIHDWKDGQDIANNNCCNAYQLPGKVDLSQFHTYGALWTPGHVAWYFDNHRLNSVATFPIFDDLQQNYYLILGSQEGANWTYGDTSGVTATSIAMQVEWVHVWQQEGNGCSAKVISE
jgi:hypothetical protein